MIYFDNSATTKPYKEVLHTFLRVNEDFYGNASSLHNFGGKSEQLLTKAREQIAATYSVKPSEIYFTSGGTESNNWAVKGIALQHRNRGNHIITTMIEHPSIKAPLEQLKDLGFSITYLPVDENGVVSLQDVQAAIKDETILVSIMHVNNEVGSIQPIREIGKLLQSYSKIVFHVDAIQAVGKIPLFLHEGLIDACSVSAHKFHGLKGSGFLYIRQGMKITPLLAGGEQENKLRSGTENVASIVAMAKALRMVEEKRTSTNALETIKETIVHGLREIEVVHLHSTDHGAPHIINFSVDGVKGEVLVHALEEVGIIISTTSACSSKQQQASSTLLCMGVSEQAAKGALRISLSYENTVDEANEFIHQFNKVLIRLLQVVRRKS